MCLRQFDICIKIFKGQDLLQNLHNQTQDPQTLHKCQCQSLKHNSLLLDWNMEVYGTNGATLDMQTVNVSTLANPHHGDLFSVCQTNITQRYYRDT